VAGSHVLVIPYLNVYCETIFSMGKKVQTDNKSQLSKNTKEGRAADNVYLGETNVSVAYLISFVVFFVTWELTLDL
jgi:uncharacterized membrane protein